MQELRETKIPIRRNSLPDLRRPPAAGGFGAAGGANAAGRRGSLPEFAMSMQSFYNAGRKAADQERHKEALDQYKAGLKVYVGAVGESVREKKKEMMMKDLEGTIYTNLASQLDAQGKLEESFAMYLRATKLAAKEFGPKHPRVAEPILKLADIRRRQAQYREALDLYEKALQIQVGHFGEGAPATQETRQAIADLSTMAVEVDGTLARRASKGRRAAADPRPRAPELERAPPPVNAYAPAPPGYGGLAMPSEGNVAGVDWRALRGSKGLPGGQSGGGGLDSVVLPPMLPGQLPKLPR